MAGVGRVISRRHYILDTGYLVEFFEIDGKAAPGGNAAVKKKIIACINENGAMYVPVPVLFEVARHVVEIKVAQRRRELAEKLVSTVNSCLEGDTPWIVIGAKDSSALLGRALRGYCEKFANVFAAKGESLTDVVVIEEARLLKERLAKRGDRRHYVHIWTRDRAVKGREPDQEEAPFI